MNVLAEECLSSTIREAYNIDDNTICRVETISPTELILSERLDVIAKIIYLKYCDLCPSLAEDVYKESIRIVTNGTFIEYGDKNKNDFNSFKRAFDELYRKIKMYGYDDNSIIPVDKNGVIIDGAHRLSIAYLLNHKVKVARIPFESKTNYGPYYFQNKECKDDILDILLQNMLEIIPDIFIANIWPAAVGHKEQIEKIFDDNDVDILYNRTVRLNDNGAYSYTYQIYFNEEWSGEIENGFAGTNRKAVPCFGDKSELRVYVLKSNQLSKVVKAKAEIRDIFNIGNHSIHITDTYSQAIEMGRLLFNRNSISFMNNSKPLKYKPLTRKLFDFCSKHNNVTITGSSVMALYGICEANDIDYFCENDDNGLVQESHNEYLDIYGLHLSEALYDPRHYFYYLSMRVLLLQDILVFKKNRNEIKDRADIKLIEEKLNSENEQKGILNLLILNIIKLFRKTLTRLQIACIKVAHRTGTYVWARKIYHILIDKKTHIR